MSTIRTTDNQGTEVILTGPVLPDLQSVQPPSNKEIHEGIKDVKATLQAEKPYMSAQGQNIVDDASELADATARLLSEKNKHERFQKLFLLTKERIEMGPSETLQDAVQSLMNKATGMGTELRVEAADLQAYLRGSIYNLLMSTEYRQLVFDFFTILKDLTMEIEKEAEEIADEFQGKQAWSKGSGWGKGFQSWEGQVSPLSPKPTTSWEGKTTEKPAESFQEIKPEWEGKKGEAKQWEGKAGEAKPWKEGEAKPWKEGEAKPWKEGKKWEGETQPLLGDQQPGFKPDVAQQQREDASRQQLSDREEQHIEMIRWRFNEFLKQLRSKKEYQLLMQNFFKYSAEIYNTFKDLKENPPPEIQDLQKLMDNIWDILGDFAGQKLVKGFRSDLDKFFSSLTENKDIAEWWNKAREFVIDALQKPDVVETEDSIKLIKDLIRTGRRVTEKYREKIDHLYDTLVEIFDNIKDDPALKNFGDKLTQLGKTLALNRSGEPDPMVIQESFSQLTTLLVRIFNGYLIELPLQQVEVYSPSYDVVLQDIKTEGTGFAPEKIEVSTASRSIMNLKNRDPSRSTFRIAFRVDNIAPVFKDFKFFFRHKTFPSYEDVGRAEYLKFDGTGLSAKAIMTIRSVSGQPSRATLDTLWVNVDGLSLRIGEQTKHQILSTLAAPIFAEVLRSKIETTVWNFLRARLQEIMVRLNIWFQSNYLGISSFGDVFKMGPEPSIPTTNIDVSKREPTRVVGEHERFVERDTMKAKVHFPNANDLGQSKELVHD